MPFPRQPHAETDSGEGYRTWSIWHDGGQLRWVVLIPEFRTRLAQILSGLFCGKIVIQPMGITNDQWVLFSSQSKNAKRALHPLQFLLCLSHLAFFNESCSTQPSSGLLEAWEEHPLACPLWNQPGHLCTATSLMTPSSSGFLVWCLVIGSSRAVS